MTKIKKLTACLILLMVFNSAKLTAQALPQEVYKDWSDHIESEKIVDVSYRIIKCNGVDQIHFLVFNENTIDQQVTFTVDIVNNVTGEKTAKEISFTATKSTVYKALCEQDTTLNYLKINLPVGYNPLQTTVTITFKD